MFTISPDTMLMVGALSGFIGFANIGFMIGYVIKGLLYPPSYNPAKVHKFADDEWPDTSDV